MEYLPREVPLTAAAAEHLIPIPLHNPMHLNRAKKNDGKMI